MDGNRGREGTKETSWPANTFTAGTKGNGLHNKNQGSQDLQLPHLDPVPTLGVGQPTWSTKPWPPNIHPNSAFLRTKQ